MKILYWNAWGLENLETQLVLQKNCATHKLEFLFLSKPWILLDDQFPSCFWKKLKLKPFIVTKRSNLYPNLWGLWADHLTPVIVSSFHQQISFSIIWENQKIFISAIYARTTDDLRRYLWLELASLQRANPRPWCFTSDFIIVLGDHEKRGGKLPIRASCEEFKAWADSHNLTHIMTLGEEFTWSNGRGIDAILR